MFIKYSLKIGPVILLSVFTLQACTSAQQQPVTAASVINTYIDIAQAGYEDSLIGAQALQEAVTDFLEAPSEAGLEAAREAWIDARVPYMQTEAYRFGNPVVDEWEARVNSWPLDEGLIDYTAGAYGDESDLNYFYTANIIANPRLSVAGVDVDASVISAELLSDTLQMIDGVESNVATGYHAVEFLLWGQDLHGTDPGAGERPWTDYSLDNCSNDHCDRRRDYLQVATDLLVSDLEEMAASWQPGGEAYMDLRSKGEEGGLATILTGLGSLAYGELAGERTRLAWLLNDPEEEHDCFSDNTHYSHFYDAQGIENVYQGHYQRTNGDVVSGPSLADLVQSTDPELATAMDDALAETRAAMQALVDQAEAGNTFDVLIGIGNEEGSAIIEQVVDSLVAETRVIERVVVALELNNVSVEGSDSLE